MYICSALLTHSRRTAAAPQRMTTQAAYSDTIPTLYPGLCIQVARQRTISPMRPIKIPAITAKIAKRFTGNVRIRISSRERATCAIFRAISHPITPNEAWYGSLAVVEYVVTVIHSCVHVNELPSAIFLPAASDTPIA